MFFPKQLYQNLSRSSNNKSLGKWFLMTNVNITFYFLRVILDLLFYWLTWPEVVYSFVFLVIFIKDNGQTELHSLIECANKELKCIKTYDSVSIIVIHHITLSYETINGLSPIFLSPTFPRSEIPSRANEANAVNIFLPFGW